MYRPQEEKQKFAAEVIERAAYDLEFREALRTNPRQALVEAYGREMRMDVEIHSDTPQKIHLVLPLFEDEMEELLDDELLDHVGGGCGIWSCIFLTF